MNYKVMLPAFFVFTFLLVRDCRVHASSPGASSSSQPTDDVALLEFYRISGQWFLNYNHAEQQGIYNSEFGLKRGYITIERSLASNLSARITSDISVDKEGDGKGDLELRLKYCYLQYHLNDFGFIAKPFLEFGLAHRPWLDFEEDINRYRVQGTMFLERIGLLNSADYGLTFNALLGDELDEAEQQRVKSAPGKLGSVSLGIYNGGGYHAVEENNNKTLEARLSLRPFSKHLPGLQLTYHGAFGKGNHPSEPKWTYSAGFLSYESPWSVLTGTYFKGTGNSYGSHLDADGNSLTQSGVSFFAEIKWPLKPLALFARYDDVRRKTFPLETHLQRHIVGICYSAGSHLRMIIDYDTVSQRYLDNSKQSLFEFAVEIYY